MDMAFFDLATQWFLETAPNYPSWFAFDFSRYLIGAGSVYLLVNVLLSRTLKNRKIRGKTPRTRQMLREFKSSALAAATFSLSGFIIDIGVRTGTISFYGDIATYGLGYFIGSLLLLIVAHDAYFYWTHRLLHLPRIMRIGHSEHHKSINPTPWTAYSFNVIEAAVHAAFLPMILLILPMHGLAVFLFLTHMIIRNAVGHSGYELFPRSWAVHPLLGNITMVTHHDMHHASGNHNFGLYFTWWDRMMGTEHPQYLAKATGNPAATRQSIGARATTAALAALVALVAASFTAPAKADDGINGLWLASDGSTVVSVERCSAKSARMCGTVVYQDTAGGDAEMGLRVLSRFKQASGMTTPVWTSGKVKPVDGGKAVKGQLTLLDNGDLKVVSCGRRGCRGSSWTRPNTALAAKATAAQGRR